ncbi:MAG: hypothetical protein U0452_12360 [Anaerolineae bacterium]
MTPPGTFLSERSLAVRLEYEQNPGTHGVNSEMEQFITISPQQGIIVRGLSLTEINRCYDLRVALETFVVGPLARQVDC